MDHSLPPRRWRGHGGSTDAADSLRQSKISLSADIDAGFSMIHLDTSTSLEGPRDAKKEIALQFDLHQHALLEGQQMGANLVFEIGGSQRTLDEEELFRFEHYLDATLRGCSHREFPLPTFVSARTGTYVAELRNLGYLDRPASGDLQDPRESLLAESADLASFAGMYLTAQNCDFLRAQALRMLYPLGISAAVIGHELGCYESRLILQLADATRSKSIRDDFLTLAYDSGVWRQMITEKSRSTELERAIMSGSAVFATPAFKAIKARLETRCGATGIHMDQFIREAHKTRILSLMRELGARVEVAPAMSL